ncbi:MAG: glycerophosphodiester phosphodiesterase [Candidatus Bipolaricaulaceae bacterium]
MKFFLALFAILAIAGEMRSSGVSKPLVIAHRGARSLAPENTLAAARTAKRLGADGWEFDVRMSKDGELILMHDETLSRTTNASELFPNQAPWSVAEFTLAEIKTLDAGSWFVESDPYGTIASGDVPAPEAESFRGERVPTLREALALSRELGLWVNIELKSRPSFVLAPSTKLLVEKTVELVRAMGMTSKVLISSFDPAAVQYVNAVAPEIPAALLVSSLPPDPLGYLRALGAEALNPRYDLVTEGLLNILSQAGFKVFIWTVNELEDLRKFAVDPRIAGIITDWPQRLLALLGRAK